MKELYPRREQPIDAVAEKAMGLAATDLHQGPGTGHPLRDGFGEMFDQGRLPKVTGGRHEGLARAGPSPRARKASRVSSASASCSMAMAHPAWTIT